MKKCWKAGTSLLLAALMLWGCGQAPAGNNQAEPEGPVAKQITVAVAQDIEAGKLDAASYNGLMQAYPLVYDALVEYGAKGENLSGLAEKWDISEDGKTYTFHLRKNVQFSDGTPFNADAVKFSIMRWANKKDHESFRTSKNIQNIEVSDEYTVKLTFSEAYYLTLTELTYARPFRIMSPTAVEPAGDPDGKFVKAIGTGAWVVSDYKQDEQAVFTPNPNYWGSKPKLGRLVFKVIPDPQTRVLALQKNDIQLAGGSFGKIPVESLSLFNSSKDVAMKQIDGTITYFFGFNNDNNILQDVNVRKALNYAINKQDIAEKLLNGIGQPAKGLFQSTVPYVTKDNEKGYGYDLDQAKELLGAAGWKDTNGDGIADKAGKPLTLSLVLQTEEYPEWKAIGEAAQSDLAKAGVQLELKVLEKGAYYDALWKNKNYDLIVYRTYEDAYNPYGFLTSLFYAADKKPVLGYGDGYFNELLDKVQSSTSEEERQQLYTEIFGLIHDQALVLPVFAPYEILLSSKKIKPFELGTTQSRPVVWEKLDINL
ncbi:nickel ABC transporter substrate-binding protein [Paenibacillus sp. GCM10027626]|uniref:nickel ABC transporter substrate-binding protein n=1 Tax=Paenibacillus sp. GCM10027626 TaxID=3273411 RepID=UPI0036400F04